jgi:MraZ protein
MFLGQHQVSIDEKGRLTIPARYRDILGDEGAYITRGFNHNLLVLPATSFERIYAKVNKTSITDPAAQKFKRFFFANASKIEFDRLGRILLPIFLRETANMQDQAVVVGSGDNFEIWSSELWKEQEDSFEDSNYSQQFADLDLSF